MNLLSQRIAAFFVKLPQRLRHPTWGGVALGLALVPALLVTYVLVLVPFTPSTSDLLQAKTAKPSVVLSADGVELAVFKRANRDRVPLSAISSHVIDALIATEDRRFYDHHGIDFRRTTGALVQSFSGNLQGGSTITQQLARNLYPEGIGRAPTLNRKIKEAITAIKIESVYSKDDILLAYLNTVPFLYNAFGIDMAARTYFDKSADQLDVLEAATLVGMLKGTSYYNPVLKPERAVQRRNIVLTQMAKNGKLTDTQLAALTKQPLKVDFERQTEPPGPAPHLAQQLRRWLIDWADRNDYNIYADGLVLHTTIDSRLQALANAAVVAQVERLQKIADADGRLASGWTGRKGQPPQPTALFQALVRDSAAFKAGVSAGQTDAQALAAVVGNAETMQKLRDDKTRVQAGFMASSPSTGHVLAWVGSANFATDQFDHVSQARRQPGSTFKPFVYGAAFEGGAKPGDALVDQLLSTPQPDGSMWQPSDGGAPSGQLMTLKQGLAMSKNTITAQVMQQVGPARVATLARAMGVRQSPLDEVPSLALGTSPVTLKEMVASYATLAHGGRYIAPVMITHVSNRGGVVLETLAAPLAETAMNPSAANTLLDVMRGVIDSGTGTAIRSRYGIRADVAGKTGTTQNNTDGWFILMHPQLVAGAWAGFNDNRVTMGDRWGPGAQSALPMVGDFFQQAIKVKLIDAKRTFSAPRDTGASDQPVLPLPLEVLPAAPESVVEADKDAVGGANPAAQNVRLGIPIDITTVTLSPGAGPLPAATPVYSSSLPSGVSPSAGNPLPEGGRPRPMEQEPVPSAPGYFPRSEVGPSVAVPAR